MDLELNQLCSILNGENSKESIDALLGQATYIEDINGVRIPVLKLKDATVGAPHLTGNHPTKLREIRSRALRDDDVIVCSYPKTGTHWISNLIHLMVQKRPLDEAVPYRMRLLDLGAPDLIESAPSPRVLASHRRPHQLPEDVSRLKKKVVLICRNPKDTAVSHFFHLCNTGYKLTWARFLEYWMEGLIPVDNFFDFYNAWQTEIKQTKTLDVLSVQYEAMQQDGLTELRRLQEFLGYSHSDEHLLKILEKCSIANLRNNVETGNVATHLVQNGKSIIFRKGVVDDWKNYFTVAQSEKMDTVIKKRFIKGTMLPTDH